MAEVIKTNEMKQNRGLTSKMRRAIMGCKMSRWFQAQLGKFRG